MLNNVYWLIPNRVVVNELSGRLMAEDFVQAKTFMKTLIPANHLHTFHVIYECSARTEIDWRLTDLSYVRDLGYLHPRLRSVIAIDKTPHPLASAVGRMVLHSHRLSLHIARTQADATAYLHKIDPTLRALIAS